MFGLGSRTWWSILAFFIAGGFLAGLYFLGNSKTPEVPVTAVPVAPVSTHE
jgi:hypothetical protein